MRSTGTRKYNFCIVSVIKKVCKNQICPKITKRNVKKQSPSCDYENMKKVSEAI